MNKIKIIAFILIYGTAALASDPSNKRVCDEFDMDSGLPKKQKITQPTQLLSPLPKVLVKKIVDYLPQRD